MKKSSPAIVVSGWAMILTLIAVLLALQNFQTSTQTEFDAQAQLRISVLQRSVNEKLLILNSMQSLFTILDGQPPSNFRTFVQPFEQELEGIQAFQWVVPVRHANRATFEATLQASGVPDYQIMERNADGEMVRAADRDVYFPIYPLLPFDSTEASFGFDLASTQVRKTVVDRALANGITTASGPIDLLQGPDTGGSGVLVLAPLFTQGVLPVSAAPLDRLAGFVLGVFSVGSLVDSVLAQFATEALQMEVYDAPTTGERALLYSSGLPAQSRALESWLISWLAPATYHGQIQVADRLWDVNAEASPGYMNDRHPYSAWLALGGGSLLALVMGLYLHITAQHDSRIQEALHQREVLENQLLRSQRMEVIGQLVGGIAHDFKNMLNAILGNADLAEHEFGDRNPGLREYTQYITLAAQRGNNLINKMLAFSRNEPAEPIQQNLKPLVSNTLAMIRPLIPSNVTIDVQVDAGLPPVTLDAGSFDQILLNLCVNARDAIHGAGTITVSLRLRHLDDSVCSSCDKDICGEFVELAVRDTGSGIPLELQGGIFDPFFTTKEQGKGTGLGLFIINNAVHGGGGHILLESAPGKGTCFRILFPADTHD